MSLEAWGDCDPAADQSMRVCPACEGDGAEFFLNQETGVTEPEQCSRCNGTGEVPDECDPLPDDVI